MAICISVPSHRDGQAYHTAKVAQSVRDFFGTNKHRRDDSGENTNVLMRALLEARYQKQFTGYIAPWSFIHLLTLLQLCS
jgi:hypothetical protein